MAYISRVVSLKGFPQIIMGRDIGKALDEGIIYGVQNVMGVITLVPIGEAVVPDLRWKIHNIITDGKHLLTKEEFRAELVNNGFLDDEDIERHINGTSSSDGV